ncbi:MAG: Ig-like domain-containing protein [Bacteroidia bacterium]|nr:Ig-like domain-containing protein [Bacteroidia bacterium]
MYYVINTIKKINANKYLLLGNVSSTNSVWGVPFTIITDTIGINYNAHNYYPTSSNMAGSALNARIISANQIEILGIKDSFALIFNIDSTGNLLNSIQSIQLYKGYFNGGNKNVNYNHDFTELLYIGAAYPYGKLYCGRYNLNTLTLIKDTLFTSQYLPYFYYGIKYGIPFPQITTFNNGNFLIASDKNILTIDSNFNILRKDTLIAKYGSSSYLQVFAHQINTDSSMLFAGNYQYSFGNGNIWSQSYLKKTYLFVYVNRISINGGNTIAQFHGTISLSANISPINAINKAVLWTVNDTNKATITQTGVVTAKANGLVIVTATTTDGSNLQAIKSITIIHQSLASSISINGPNSITQSKGIAQLTSVILPIDAANNPINWMLSDTAVASVTQTGLVTAKANGVVNITATTTDGTNLSSTKTIIITNQILASSISISGQNYISQNGGIIQLGADILPGAAANNSVVWTVIDTTKATITQAGIIKAKANGMATITAALTDGSNLQATKVIIITNQGVGLRDEISNNDVIEIYPNLASDEVIIKSTSNLVSFVLYDVLGNEFSYIETVTKDQNKYILKTINLKSGVYFIVAKNINGQAYNKRIQIIN